MTRRRITQQAVQHEERLSRRANRQGDDSGSKEAAPSSSFSSQANNSASEGNLAVGTAIQATSAPATRGNQPVRNAMMLQMQHTLGNRAVQRFASVQRKHAAVQRHGNPEEEPEGDEPMKLQTRRADVAVQRHGNPEEEPEGDEPMKLQTKRDGTSAPAAAPAVQRVDGQQASATVQRVITGIAKGKAVGSYVAEVKGVQIGWAALKPNARAAQLVKAANTRLKEVGCPPCNVSVNAGAGNGASFNFTTWTIDLDGGVVNKNAVTDDEMAEVADTVYHEARHAEQWWRMARYQAGLGKKAAEIKTAMVIPADIAQKAKDNPLKASGGLARAFMSKEKIAEEEKMLEEAAAWYDNIYGAGRVQRNAVLTGLDTKADAVKAAVADRKAKSAEVTKKEGDLNKVRTEAVDLLKKSDEKDEIRDKRQATFKKEKAIWNSIHTKYEAANAKGEASDEDYQKTIAAQAKYNKILKSTQTAEKAAKKALETYNAKVVEYDAAVKALEAAQAGLTAAEKTEDTARKDNAANYKKYKELTEEADAWALGGKVQSAYKA